MSKTNDKGLTKISHVHASKGMIMCQIMLMGAKIGILWLFCTSHSTRTIIEKKRVTTKPKFDNAPQQFGKL